NTQPKTEVATMKLLAQFIPALSDLALLSPKQVEVKLIEREVVEKTFIFDRTISPKWWRSLL
ncbi:MAG: hypothetical protein DMF31_05935, partial [Verrucomicrobia bacterium]